MTFGIIGNINKTVIKKVASSLFTYLIDRNIKFFIHEELGKWYTGQGINPKIEDFVMTPDIELPEKCDIIIALGGDGTMLSAARLVGASRVPILGVNLGKLGFLAEVSIDELDQCLDDVIGKKYYIEDRMALSASVHGDNKYYFALNDVVIDKGSSSRIIDMEIYVNDEYLVTFTADGIIISTPTGSTAYSLACGGPIITPNSNVIQINPIAPHNLSARPVIIPDNSIVKVVVRESSKPVHMTSDGQIEKFYPAPVELTVKRASHTVRLIKRKERDYYNLLRMKLMWGKDVRISNHG